MKSVVKENNVNKIEFPCLRKGMNTGNIYLFTCNFSEGICLTSEGGLTPGRKVPLSSTIEFYGSITLTQE